MASKVRLPRKRFFNLKGNEIELAVGLLLVSMLDAKAANATVARDGLTGTTPSPDAPPPTLEQMLGVAPDAVKTITIEELKAHLTGAVLTSLGLDDKFLELLDHDRAAAIRELEAAYRKKLAAFAGEGSHHAVVAQDGEHARADAHGDAHQSDDGDVGFLGMGSDFTPLLILGGVAGIAAAGIIATNNDGGGSKNQAPTAVNDAVTTNEDTPTTFDVRTNDTDANGDTLTVTQINGTNITTTSPVTITGGVISLGADGRLTFTPTANYNGTPTFTYTVSDGHGGTSTATVNLTVTSVNDAPVNAVPSSIAASAGAALTIGGLGISDPDGAGNYTTTLKVGNGTLTVGTVNGGATVVGSGTGTITLTGSLDQINATLKAIGYTSGAGFLGNTTLTITTSDGSLTDTDTVTLSVSQVINGVAQDGYIAGATVFLDLNGNGILDAGEQSTTTDASGHFAFAANSAGVLTVVGGTNTDTNLPNTLTFTAPFGSTVVNPLTTLIVELMQTGVSLDAAKAMVAAALGLPDGIDLTTYDFLSPTNDPAVALQVQKAAVEIATVLAIAGAAAGAGNAAAVQAAVMDHIIASIKTGGTIDLTNVNTIHDLLSGTGLSDSAVNAAAAQASAINEAVHNADSPSDIAGTIVDTHPGTGTPPPSDILPVTQESLPGVIEHAADYAALGITTLDVVGDVVSLNGTQANALVAAGLHFADADDVTLTTGGEGTHLSTTLKGLADLHVDTVMIGGAPVTIEAGVGLGAISADGLPHFVGVGGIDPTVTLNVQAGTLDPSLDITALATALHNAGVDHIGVVGGELILTEAQALELVNAGITIVPAADVGLTLTEAQVHALALDPSLIASASVDHLDVVGDHITLTDAEAGALIGAGVDFVTGDDVQVNADGTHLSTTLRGLADLHVDTVMINGTSVTLEAGAGLGGISADGLPHFVSSGGIDPTITLNVQAGSLDPSLDLTSLATALHDAGVDHIGVVGGELILTDAQALALVNAGLDIVPAADVGLTLTESQVHALALDPSLIASASVDHLDVVGDHITLTDAEAGALIGAGVDFVTGDDVQVNADGTHLSTTLKGLADLHVDTVMINGASHSLVIDAGASLATLSTEALPHFVADATGGAVDVDVTLNLAGGTIDPLTDLSAIAHSLSDAGIDHLGVSDGSALSLSLDQAIALGNAGLDFTSAADVTVNLTAAQLASMTFDPASIGVDHLHVDGGSIALTDTEASALVAAGVDFVASDDVAVHAAGTHLSNTLHDLQALHVDTISVDGGVTQLHLSAGDLSTISADSLPQFDVAQSDASLDVTLRVDPTQLNELDRLGAALRDAGIDHFGLDAPLDSYDADTQAHMASISATTGIGFVYDPDTSASAMSFSTFSQDAVVDDGGDHGLVQQIIAAFEQLEDHGSGGQVVVQDDVIPALADSGALRAYTADTLVVDGTHSGDQLLTTLKDIADLGVDHVKVSDTGGPAFVDIGSFTGDELSQVKQLFETLDQNVPGTKIFEGNSHVALVVDESVAHALSQVEGGMEKLASMGFTEVDVLMNSGSTTPPIVSTAVEVKLIGQDDDLYKHLHHD
jgi:hypothetical protein